MAEKIKTWGDRFTRSLPPLKGKTMSPKILEGVKEIDGSKAVDAIIKTALMLIESLDHSSPCFENKEACAHLTEALTALENRRKYLAARGLKGTKKN